MQEKSKIYLVTGAAGFIGSSVAENLVLKGHKVITVDNLSTGYIEAIPESVTFIKGDCFDPKIIKLLSNYQFDAIIHIAGQSSGEISFDNPIYDLQTNTQSTLLLLNLAKDTGCKQFIYASTMSVYGNQPDEPIDEKQSTNPISFYGVGKIASEKYLKIYEQFGIKTISLRLFNVYGPGQNLKNLRQGMVSIFLAMALKDKLIHVKGNSLRFRDFVYIDDVVNAFNCSLDNLTNHSEIINICTGVKTTIEELIERIIQKLDFKIKVVYEGYTPGDQFGIVGDNKRAKKIINWTPEIGLDAGLTKMINWAKNFESSL